MLSGQMLLDTTEKMMIVYTKEELSEVFNALYGQTNIVFIEFLTHPMERYTAYELMEKLGMPEATIYRCLKKLRKVRLIQFAGSQSKRKVDTKWGFKKSGGPYADLWALREELYIG